jgi:hypothetical protein
VAVGVSGWKGEIPAIDRSIHNCLDPMIRWLRDLIIFLIHAPMFPGRIVSHRLHKYGNPAIHCCSKIMMSV